MTKNLRIAALAAAMSGAAMPVNAAADTIATLLAKVDQIVKAEGYQPEGWSQTGSLTADSERTFEWEPSKAKGYVLVGVCDEGCDDLDISVEDEDGKTIAEDDADDDTPMVQVGRLTDVNYTVRVSMPTCTTRACRFAVRSYRK